MSNGSNMDLIDGKTIRLKDNHEKLTSVDATCRNSVVDCFKNKSMEFYTKQLDFTSVQAYKTLKSTGKIF